MNIEEIHNEGDGGKNRFKLESLANDSAFRDTEDVMEEGNISREEREKVYDNYYHGDFIPKVVEAFDDSTGAVVFLVKETGGEGEEEYTTAVKSAIKGGAGVQEALLIPFSGFLSNFIRKSVSSILKSDMVSSIYNKELNATVLIKKHSDARKILTSFSRHSYLSSTLYYTMLADNLLQLQKYVSLLTGDDAPDPVIDYNDYGDDKDVVEALKNLIVKERKEKHSTIVEYLNKSTSTMKKLAKELLATSMDSVLSVVDKLDRDNLEDTEGLDLTYEDASKVVIGLAEAVVTTVKKQTDTVYDLYNIASRLSVYGANG